MPELPELEVLREKLTVKVKGKKIKSFQVLKPYVLKNIFEGDLSNETIKKVSRRGKYLILDTDEHSIVIHLMLDGSLRYSLPTARLKKSTNALIVFTDGTTLEFSERGHKKRMAIHVISRGGSLVRISNLGVDPLGKDFTVDTLGSLLKRDSKRLKSFLCSQSRIAGIGNAYADEILWKARLSPFKLSSNLNEAETKILSQAVVDVLKWALEHVRHARQPENRSFLNVHGKKGKTCPRCGDVIRCVSFRKNDTFYCPMCQTGGRRLKDRRMSVFYR
ncbi:hypothetical protein AMJ83_00890 [candidate division WOR_3 bacterium SM23_42]|uniref:Uncharacterized protein n=1 Tax=candidate division WOR_3 bacterium SM23_42 TaxID=1703779 RepID=A0A0S8FVU1_UNCW3|nr:MAG: hypothetical protein AMJ83_00890 [candidate division WOR_3 bacterium SM23_42]